MSNEKVRSTVSPAEVVRRLRAPVVPPVGGGNTIDWSQIVDDYGHAFPDDYRVFMEVYGEGMFDDFLGVQPSVSEAYVPSSPVREV